MRGTIDNHEPRAAVRETHSDMHGIMFHHFYGGEKHIKSQGAISADRLSAMLDWLEARYAILDPETFFETLAGGRLQPEHICLTFDDALKSQFDIAFPVLQRRGLRAFFFVYSAAFSKPPPKLEFYRDFRFSMFPDVEDFYAAFFNTFARSLPGKYDRYLADYPVDYLAAFPFYSENDRRFRFARDRVLMDDFESILDRMMDDSGYDMRKRQTALFMAPSDLRALAEAGQVVGLHSHSHPYTIKDMPQNRQRTEYENNRDFLAELLGTDVWAMSHPCGSYGDDTLAILRDLSIRLGFRSSMTPNEIHSTLEIPREDHANILRTMQGDDV